jgi:ketosteroid isomerase-like protein
VRRSLEAFARGDFDAAFAAYDPESVWCTAADEPDQRTYRGIEELRSFAESLGESWEDRFEGVMEFDDFIERSDWVVVPWTARLHGRTSGAAVDVSETYAIQLRGGRIVRVDEYRHVDQALERL